MIKPFSIFIVSALLSAGIQLAGSGCGSDDDATCICPPFPKWPPNKLERPIVEASDQRENNGRPNSIPVDLEGTISVEDERVTILYSVDGAQREAVYRILPNE